MLFLTSTQLLEKITRLYYWLLSSHSYVIYVKPQFSFPIYQFSFLNGEHVIGILLGARTELSTSLLLRSLTLKVKSINQPLFWWWRHSKRASKEKLQLVASLFFTPLPFQHAAYKCKTKHCIW